MNCYNIWTLLKNKIINISSIDFLILEEEEEEKTCLLDCEVFVLLPFG